MPGQHQAPSTREIRAQIRAEEKDRRRRAREGRTVETSEFESMLLRNFKAWRRRVAGDPAAVVLWAELMETFADETNIGLFLANRAGPSGNPYSMNEIAKMLGCSRQAVQQRIHRGEEAYAREQARAGAGPMVRLADIRRRRAAALEAAGVPDKTGSERERTALRNVG